MKPYIEESGHQSVGYALETLILILLATACNLCTYHLYFAVRRMWIDSDTHLSIQSHRHTQSLSS